MVILDVEEASDSISNFHITDEVKKNLDKFRELEGTVPERINKLTYISEGEKKSVSSNIIDKLIKESENINK